MTRAQLGLLLVSYLITGTVGLVLLKRGLPADVSVFPLSVSSVTTFALRSFNVQAIVGFVCYASSFALSLVVMAALPINRAYPLLIAVAYVGAIGAGLLVLGERMTWSAAAGLLLIGAGILLVGSPKQ